MGWDSVMAISMARVAGVEWPNSSLEDARQEGNIS